MIFATPFLSGGVSPLELVANNASGTEVAAAPSGMVTTENGPGVVASGGSGSYTYSWGHIDTDGGTTPAVSNGAIANPTWTVEVDSGTPSSSTWRLTVTDTETGATAIDTITVTLTWVDIT